MRSSAVVLLCMVALFCAVEAAPTKKRPSKYVPTPRPGTHPKKHGCRGKRCYRPQPKDEKVNRADSNTDIYINGYHGTATAYTDASSTKKQVESDSVAAGEIYDAYMTINTDGEAFGPNRYAATDVNMQAGAQHATLIGGATANAGKKSATASSGATVSVMNGYVDVDNEATAATARKKRG